MPPQQPPLISVVMPTFNRAHWVAGAIGSLQRQETAGEFGYEIIVVDNASQDDTRRVVGAALGQSTVPAKYIRSEPPGDAPTRNAGIRAAAGQWLAFFDDDQFAEPQWLLELWRAAGRSGGRIVGGPVRLDLTPQQLRRLGRLGRLALREIDFYPTLQPYRGKDLPGTGNVLIDRRLFDEVGLFDESMTGGGSDFRFFEQARRRGHQLWYSPRAAIRHRIEPNRLTPAYHRWEAMSGGAHQALQDGRQRGPLVLLAGAAARIGRSLLVGAPAAAFSRLARDPGGVLSRRIQWWRAAGYLRGALKSQLPRLFPQRQFFESLDFRLGREVGKDAAELNKGQSAARPAGDSQAPGARQLEPAGRDA